MKKVFARISVAAVMCLAAGTQAQAANIYYTSQYQSGRWVLTWDKISSYCDFMGKIQGQWTLSVDGVVQPEVKNSGSGFGGGGGMAYRGDVYITGPDGKLDSALLAGTTSFACGTDTIVIGSAPVVSAPTNTVPTLTEWGMMAMGSLIAGFGALRLRRRERSTAV